MSDKYPELEKAEAIHEQTQAVGGFLDWLLSNGYTICQWREAGDNGEPIKVYPTGEELDRIEQKKGLVPMLIAASGAMNPAYDSWPAGYTSVHKSIEQWLADYFGLDLPKLEQERQQIFTALRSQHNAE